jgi:hypothetical protein
MKKNIDNIEDAVKIIIDSAIKHSIASENGDYKVANKNYMLLQEAIYFLRDKNRIDKLQDLISHNDISVRLSVASYLLIHNEEMAISVIKNIIEQKIPHKSFTARMVMEEWKKGNLKL